MDFLKNNLQNILLVAGGLAVLFWPQFSALIKQQLNKEPEPEQSGGKTSPVDNNCCCCPTETPIDDVPKSEWVVRAMEVRSYCLEHRLGEGVKLCEELVSVLVADKPDTPEKAVVVVKKEIR